MKGVATISFRDLDSGDEAAVFVRLSTDHVALALTLREGGDLEVVIPCAVCDDPIAALAKARRLARPS